MQRVFTRVCNWNAKRYAQEYNKELTLSLLQEEFLEWAQAETEVDKLDALCDMTYVAMGGLWKLNAPEEESEANGKHSLTLIDNLVALNELNPAYFIATFLTVYMVDTHYPPIQMMHHIIACSLAQMLSMGLDYNQCIEALLIVCDSNDTKSIHKTASNVKANVVKGEFYRRPEPRLTELLEQRSYDSE